MSAEILADHEGHRWPITGVWCSSCGLPMHPVLIQVGIHPTCDGRPL